MIGLELDDARAVAVRVDGQGNIEARAQVDGAGGLAAAAKRALEMVEKPADATLGVAAINPDTPAIAKVIAGLARSAVGPTVMSGSAAAAAEAWVGAARGVPDVAYFAVGHHATGGIVRGGVAIAGARGRAGSIGWLALNPVEREDYRKTGCLEAEVAAAGLVRRLIWRIKAGDRSRVQDVVKDDLAAITAAANLVVVADPEMLVLGGIMASAADLLLEPLRTELARRLPKPMMDALKIETATLGADAAAIGAAHLAAAARP